MGKRGNGREGGGEEERESFANDLKFYHCKEDVDCGNHTYFEENINITRDFYEEMEPSSEVNSLETYSTHNCKHDSKFITVMNN